MNVITEFVSKKYYGSQFWTLNISNLQTYNSVGFPANVSNAY